MANETITGKIFTLKDPTGTYNRFPRTVMEAVYGLNTYLQNQFSALADIYMPIEGITESKPLQEFVYRACPSSIKAKSVSLDRIYGKTLAWNQLVSSSASSVTVPSGRKYLSVIGGTKSIGTSSGSAITVTGGSDMVIDLTLLYGSEIDGMTDAEILAKFESEFPGYHSYEAGKLISNDAESIETVGFNQWDEEWENMYYPYGVATPSNFVIGSKNLVPVISGKTYFFNTPYGQNFVCYYDAEGNYIVGHPDYTDQGRVFVNALSTLAIPSGVAFIRFSYYKDGMAISYNHDICINLSDPAKNGTYEPYRKSTMQLNLGSFQVRDSQGNVTTITGGLKSAGDVKDEIVGNKYIKRVGRVDLGTVTGAYYNNNDHYYLALSLPDYKIDSANLIIPFGEITTAAEIYISKYGVGTRPGEQSVNVSHPSEPISLQAFNNVCQGVMLYYELATPIEYELVSPLVPTVKAGITEARISPNSDGLSAPMVADMTYDAQANNDSASSQYALTAGRLLNSHKLWGQDFDGSGNVTGDMSNVGNIAFSASGKNIASLLYFDTTNSRVGIGTASPQYKLDVSGTFRTTGAATFGSTLAVSGNSTVGGTLGVTGATTLSSTLGVTGNTTLSGNLTVGASNSAKATTLYGTLNATGATTLGSTLSVAGNATMNGALGLAGLATIAGGIKVTTTKKIWFGDTYYIELDSNGNLHTNAGFYSDSFITAGSTNSNA